MLLSVHYRVMEHLEVWIALKKLELPSAIASGNSYASFVLSKLPACSI